MTTPNDTSARPRWAAKSTAASFRWHYLIDESNVARCGEYRYSWLRLDQFACPEAFTPCPVCEAAS